MKTLKQFTHRGMLMLLSMFVVVSLSGFKILDPASKNDLLRQLAELLDARGIDVMLDWTSNVSTEDRPVLAPLANYRLPSEQNASMFQEAWVQKFDGWVKAFDNGDLQLMLAAPNAGKTNTFKMKWDQANPAKRIFVSFAREDALLAANVREILEQKGFTVFTFLTDSDMELDADRIAYYMTTSGNRFVLDTEHARIKSGVLAESLAEARYTFAVNKKLASRIGELKTAIEANDYNSIFMNWKKEYPDMSDAEIEQKLISIGIDRSLSSEKYKSVRTGLLNELNREQTSGRAQVEIILKVLDIICPYYLVPKVVCPICSKSVFTKIN